MPGMFLTDVMGLPKDKLYATVHEGDSQMQLGPDEEAQNYWAQYLPGERILAFPTKDNFWAMGDTGPCGPCSEILIDQGESMGCGRPDCKPGCDCDRYLELWNLVFMQFNRTGDGVLDPLPKPSIDTGMGLERVAAVIQGVRSNYETDLFSLMLQKIEEISGHRCGVDAERDVSIKVIADHSRAAAFLIGDGILPSNEGRGYVLRRVIRRALRHGRFLGIDRPFLNEVAVSVMHAMKDFYPELLENRNYITRVILHEEERFSDTLDHGLKLLQSEIKRLQDEGTQVIPGALIFKLYDTYGFPIDIVTDMARDLRFEVDEPSFQQLMEKQRQQSRLHWRGSGERELSAAYHQLSVEGIKTQFLGYERLETESAIVALVQGETLLREIAAGSDVELLTAETPFYGEAGGQMGDQGEIQGPMGKMRVADTLKLPGDLIVHVGQVVEGFLKVGDRVQLRVDRELRQDVALNHTATHILHAVLRQVLGDHVKQSGSMVAADRLRFDFTHFTAVTPEELREIERLVNAEIRGNRTLEVHVMGLEEALQTGAVALFEEKYGDRVRLVEIPNFSRELCGGTHTHATGDIGLFLIVQESSVAAGVRRIEAVTGRGALAYVQQQQKLLGQTAGVLKTNVGDIPDRVEKLLQQQKQLEKDLESLKSSMASRKSTDLLGAAEEINGTRVLVTQVEAANPKILREMNDQIRERLTRGIVVLGAAHEGKAFLLVGVTPDLTDKFHAGQLIKEIARHIGGSGGGRADMAQAGGDQPQHLQVALTEAKSLLRERLAV